MQNTFADMSCINLYRIWAYVQHNVHLFIENDLQIAKIYMPRVYLYANGLDHGVNQILNSLSIQQKNYLYLKKKKKFNLYLKS